MLLDETGPISTTDDNTKVAIKTGVWYDERTVILSFPRHWEVSVHWPDTPPPLSEQEIGMKLDCPIGQPPLHQLARGKTRPLIIEVLVKSLNKVISVNREERTVYTENITEAISPGLKEQAILAARLIHSKFSGVDIITADPSAPLEKGGGIITEVNTTPGLHHHYDLAGNYGTPPAILVLQHLLEAGPRKYDGISTERNDR